MLAEHGGLENFYPFVYSCEATKGPVAKCAFETKQSSQNDIWRWIPDTRTWWNWYTRTLEGRMPQGLEVRVLSSAPKNPEVSSGVFV